MNVLEVRTKHFLSTLHIRLAHALPSVVLGTMFNILDAVSTGLLVFPSDDGTTTTFHDLQLQGLSMYIMSTIMSQVAMTLGGSRFPGALGAMLIEILPFLRGIGSDIRDVLGNDHPGLVPTVMAAYALTSFLIGGGFIILGLLRLGHFVSYFPQTVLTGAIGAIGVSLFVLGLSLSLPASSPALQLSSAGSTLFARSHLALLAASLLPPFFLSITLRSRRIDSWTKGIIQNAYYVPVYLLMIPVIFWIVVGATHRDMEGLIESGWLFRVATATGSSRGKDVVASWNYWVLFDFSKVEWPALKNATTNIVLLVVIGILNLPIYVPALAFTLDVPYNMNHEFFGQGVANVLAGAAGTVPNILQYSYSVFVTRAHGGRFELTLVTLLTFALFLTSSLLLPYIPTILASGLVVFLGVELFLEAVWESADKLPLLEWGVGVGTLVACTFLGFAEGVGVGLGVACVVYLVYGVVDSPARVVKWQEWTHHDALEDAQLPVHHHSSSYTSEKPTTSNTSQIDIPSIHNINNMNSIYQANTRVVVLSGYVFFASIPSMTSALLSPSSPSPSTPFPKFTIVDLTTAHRLETAAAQCLLRCKRDLLARAQPTIMVMCGVVKGGGVHADLERAGVRVLFGGIKRSDTLGTGEKGETRDTNEPGKKDPVDESNTVDGSNTMEGVDSSSVLAPAADDSESSLSILTFETRKQAMVWCEKKNDERVKADLKKLEAEDFNLDNQNSSDSNNYQNYKEFCNLFGFVLSDALQQAPDTKDTKSSEVVPSEKPTLSDFQKFLDAGGSITTYRPGETIVRPASPTSSKKIFLVKGSASIIPSSTTTTTTTSSSSLTSLALEPELRSESAPAASVVRPSITRPSLRRFLAELPRETFRVAKRRLSFFIESLGSGLTLPDPEKALDSKTLGPKRNLEAGDVFDWERGIDIGIDAVLVAQTRVVVVGMKGEALMGWAERFGSSNKGTES